MEARVMKNKKDGHLCAIQDICRTGEHCLEVDAAKYLCICDPFGNATKGCVNKESLNASTVAQAKKYRKEMKEKEIYAKEMEFLAPNFISAKDESNEDEKEDFKVKIASGEVSSLTGFENCRKCSLRGSECLVIGDLINSTLCLCLPGYNGEFCQNKVSSLKIIWQNRGSLYFYIGIMASLTLAILIVIMIMFCWRKRKRDNSGRHRNHKSYPKSKCHSAISSFLALNNIKPKKKSRGSYKKLKSNKNEEHSFLNKRTSADSAFTLNSFSTLSDIGENNWDENPNFYNKPLRKKTYRGIHKERYVTEPFKEDELSLQSYSEDIVEYKAQPPSRTFKGLKLNKNLENGNKTRSSRASNGSRNRSKTSLIPNENNNNNGNTHEYIPVIKLSNESIKLAYPENINNSGLNGTIANSVNVDSKNAIPTERPSNNKLLYHPILTDAIFPQPINQNKIYNNNYSAITLNENNSLINTEYNKSYNTLPMNGNDSFGKTSIVFNRKGEPLTPPYPFIKHQ
ncbi:GATA zinc finger domain-containing protein 14-like [Gordionus sp. m RMFG-2023]|uniref:GATA zinc finger domain-containing protein 14-like n=1 Tax=Gordionus sp. m RMFG-2023 TaxID=3053472 RepID=UPI0031FC840D